MTSTTLEEYGGTDNSYNVTVYVLQVAFALSVGILLYFRDLVMSLPLPPDLK